MAELLKRNWIAALAPRNAPDFDIIATNGEADVRIRVKTKSAQYDGWKWASKKDGTIIRRSTTTRDFVVLVDLHPGTERNDYYMLSTPELIQWLTDDFAQWVATPGRGGRPHDPGNRLVILSLRKHRTRLEPYKEAWDTLWEPRNLVE